MKLFVRQRQHPELHRRSSDESYSSTSTTSTSKTHRRTTPLFTFNEWIFGAAQQDPGSDASVKANATDPLNMSWNSSGSVALSSADVMIDRWTESTIRIECLDGGVEDNSHASEIIRQLLSFSPLRRTQKRADTADTASSSSDADHEDSTSIGLLDLQQRDSLLGLQYLPDDETCLQ